MYYLLLEEISLFLSIIDRILLETHLLFNNLKPTKLRT